MKYYCNENMNQFYYFSLLIHLGVFGFLLANGIINFSGTPIDMNINERPVQVRLGQVRNTRMKEQDKKNFYQQKQNKNNETNKPQTNPTKEKKINPEKQQEKPNQKTISKNEIYGKTDAQKEVTHRNPNKKNQLELRKKQQNNKNNNQARSYEEFSNKKNNKPKRNEKVSLFDPLEDISACSSYEECRSISDVHKLQFKNEVIEFIRSNWEVPDYLLDKELKVSVLIEFDKNGYITHYEIKEHPDNKAYRALVNSIKQLFHLMTKKPLPVKGKKLSSNSIIFTFAPMYN